LSAHGPLKISGLSVALGGMPVVRDLSLSVAPGDFIGLIGPNGAGKSTLLRTLAGLITPDQGDVHLGGASLADLRAEDRARHIAYVPQEHDIAWPIAVEALVSLGRGPHRSGFALSSRDHEIVAAAMQRMDVEKFAKRPATALSGGEKARVLIARALAQDTPVLLADEPAAGLDPAHQITLMRVFRSLANEGRSVIVSMHDLGLAARWCSRLVLMDRGQIVVKGPPDHVLTAEWLRTVYGITAEIGSVDGKMLVQPLDLANR